MPHRLQPVYIGFIYALECIGLGFAAIMAGINNLLDEQSWDRLTGRHGALFFMAVALLIFWNSSRLREKREAKRMEQAEQRENKRRELEELERHEERKAVEHRHNEAMALQQTNLTTLGDLTAEGIKAQLLVATSLKALEKGLEGRPCQCYEEIKAKANEEALRKLGITPKATA